MSSKFCTSIIDEINKFRQNPKSISKKLSTFKTGLSRFKGNESFLREIESFSSSLNTMSKMPKLEKNDDLCKSAETELQNFLDDENYDQFQRGNKLKGKIPDAYVQQDCCLIADEGAETEADVPIKILLNKLDKSKIGRYCLTNSDYTQIGVAHENANDENFVVIVLGKKKEDAPKKETLRSGRQKVVETKVVVEEQQVELPEGDLTELKQAFDLFDVNKIGKIDPKETCGAMRSLNFDQNNPELYKIMKELDTPDNVLVDFPTFATHIIGKISDKQSDEGLRTIFNLFVEDQAEDKITLLTLKKIVKELGEHESEDEVDRLLRNKGGANAFLTFDEFKAYMNKVYGK